MWSIVCALFVVVAFACHWLLRQRRKCFDAFDGTGVPTVPLRSWINGNSDEFWKPSTIERISQWLKEYGNVFGFFIGDTPFVVTSDLEMINEIFIKDSSKFQRRGHLFHIYEHNPLFNGYVMFSKGSQWQAPRSCLSQFFTSSKLRAVMPSLLNAQRELIGILGQHADNGVEVDIHSLCERFTFDVICKAAFCLDTNVQRNPDNPLFKKAVTVVPNVNSGFLYHLGQNLYHWPWLLRLPSKVLGAFYTNPLSDMTTKAAEIIMYRRTNPQVRVPDMAQILLDNLVDGEVTEVRKSEVPKESAEAPLPAEILNRLASNGMAVFIGGYEPAKVVMTNWFYVMGRYPDVQEKMRQEALDAFAKEGDHLSLQTLTTLPYSNQVIFEIMRLYPATVIATTRSSDEDYRYGKYVIKKGTSVMVPTYQLHHDPRYWNEPEKFDPERFSPENKHSINPTAYQPFGLGPRMCPGHRLAVAELVSAAAEILRHYSIALGRNQKRDLELRTYSIMAASKEKVFIRLRRLHAT